MERRSFSGNYVKTELDTLAKKIPCQITFFVIGGLALINYGLKSATKDIDIVVTSKAELETIIAALGSMSKCQ
jgi:hypothetical protein